MLMIYYVYTAHLWEKIITINEHDKLLLCF